MKTFTEFLGTPDATEQSSLSEVTEEIGSKNRPMSGAAHEKTKEDLTKAGYKLTSKPVVEPATRLRPGGRDIEPDLYRHTFKNSVGHKITYHATVS